MIRLKYSWYRTLRRYSKQYLAVFILLLVISPQVHAARLQMVYATLDLDKVIAESIAYQSFRKKWDIASQKYHKEIEQEEFKITKLEKKLSEETKITPQDLGVIRQQIGVFEINVQKLIESRNEILDKAFAQAMDTLKNEINAIVTEYAQSSNLHVVLPRTSLVYAYSGVDITEKIINRLNQRFHTIEVSLSAEKT